jgi:hypothetical protein
VVLQVQFGSRCRWGLLTHPQRPLIARCLTPTIPHSGTSDGAPTAMMQCRQVDVASPDIQKSSDHPVAAVTVFRRGYEAMYTIHSLINMYTFISYPELVVLLAEDSMLSLLGRIYFQNTLKYCAKMNIRVFHFVWKSSQNETLCFRLCYKITQSRRGTLC